MKRARTYYQIYENKRQGIGKFIALIDGKNAKEALIKFKKYSKIKGIAVRDYGIRFFIPLTKGVFYYE